ncbi:biotin--[acetyl-CoA-carboxylase] ligase [Microbacterium fluvii]|uniref:biotin--[biotin carboxyl-carrier protein] ligase n=1 Tax=Microbacterium fluvii TaxID=415215 RepID=A0ABW2H9L6_9MICO|nr:biotin--[acetyl-CoA-carboxylase] ligase [Microbacterium fluvii]MCU4671408.1 biotin--[acetyl-CoA-carboxylase] ligase [Microbacterium fluvii]
MSEGYPRAAAVSPRLQVVESTGSTNADLVELVTRVDQELLPHLSVVLTRDQRAGRGRLDRSWTAPAGTALAVSVLLRVPDLPTHARGWIPLLAGDAMAHAVGGQLRDGGHSVALKWPNDVLLDGAKLCGILAEAVPHHPDAVVVGAGVNTTMTPADLPVATATSFAAVGLTVDEDRLLADYLEALAAALDRLVAAGGDAEAAGLRAQVQERCATVGGDVRVALPDGSTLEGAARRIDPDGRLVVEPATGGEVAVSAGDVVHVR